MDFVSSRRRLEDLPSDGAKAIDVISGSLFRIFQRIEELNAAVARLGRRIAVLEQPPAAPVAPEPVKLATPQPVRPPCQATDKTGPLATLRTGPPR